MVREGAASNAGAGSHTAVIHMVRMQTAGGEGHAVGCCERRCSGENLCDIDRVVLNDSIFRILCRRLPGEDEGSRVGGKHSQVLWRFAGN